MLEQYFRVNEVAGVHIGLNQDGTVMIHSCKVTANGNQLTIDKKVPGIDSLEQLKKHYDPKTPIALVLSGKGILQRQTEKTEEINPGNFTKILPNATFDDFYIQNFISGYRSFVSVIRKTEADKWIGQLTNAGFIPLSISLGPFAVQNVIPQLNLYEKDIIFSGNIIQRNEDGNWINVIYDPDSSAPFALKIDNESIPEKFLIPYAAAFQVVLASKIDPVQAEVEVLGTAFKDQLTFIKLKVTGFLILSVFFVLLLVNFLLFSWLNTSNTRLSKQVSRYAQSTTDIQQVSEQIKQNETLLKTLGWEGNINKSVLIDQLAALLPPDVAWKEAAVDPIDISASRVRKSVVFYNRRIRITGTSAKIIPVNEWIARIKTRPWIKNVQLDNYTFNTELNTGQFNIVIDY